jgi:hypothetical protein
MPRDVHRKIQREADRHGQTINAEILKRLENSFQSDKMFEGILATHNAKLVRMMGLAALLAGDWRTNKIRFEALEEAVVWILYAAALDLVKREREKFEKEKPTREQLTEEAARGGEFGSSIAQIVITNELPQLSANEAMHEHSLFNLRRTERNKIRWERRPSENPLTKLRQMDDRLADKKGATDD